MYTSDTTTAIGDYNLRVRASYPEKESGYGLKDFTVKIERSCTDKTVTIEPYFVTDLSYSFEIGRDSELTIEFYKTAIKFDGEVSICDSKIVIEVDVSSTMESVNY